MPRPIKFRKVDFFPENNYFVPVGKPKCHIQNIELKLEELEAMRLKDIEGLNQEDCAKCMGISRQTFQNIVDSARKKVAIALTEGQAVHIGGGNYTSKNCKNQCLDCGHVYAINYEKDITTCPACGSKNIVCQKKGNHCNKWCRSGRG